MLRHRVAQGIDAEALIHGVHRAAQPTRPFDAVLACPEVNVLNELTQWQLEQGGGVL
jgi:hypothetical protein